MIPEFADLIAGKMVELAELAKIYGGDEKIFTAAWGGDLMKLALKKFHDSNWRRDYRATQECDGPAAKKQKTGAALTTKVLLWDDGKQRNELQTIKAPLKRNQVDDVPWNDWMDSVFTETYIDEKIAKRAFEQCCLWHFSHMKVSKSPVAIQIVNGKTKVMAASDILPGCLQLPVFCRNDSNYLTLSSPVHRSFHEVIGEVSWFDNKTAPDMKSIQIG